MKNYFKFSIPKPCHEDWEKMTPNEKGRFCNSCVKTVVDFTKKSTTEIQDFLIENKNQNVCGHFQTKQLDTITIEIPNAIFNQELSFRKLFIVAAFFAMGTTLFSCKYSDEKKQKIENVIVIDTVQKIEKSNHIDSMNKNKDTLFFNMKNIPPPPKAFGMVIIETEGEVVFEEIEEEEEIIEDVVFGMVISKNPRFMEAKGFSEEKAKINFENRIRKIINKNININSTNNFELNQGKHKFFIQFKISELGKISINNIKPVNKFLEKEMQNIFFKISGIIPGEQAGRPVKSSYTLPITFIVE